ncbi:4Fe-4S binding protein, partial [Myxococcota bacterium]|nr:4Fe-4S binding protein [Myxococcota bacterium]
GTTAMTGHQNHPGTGQNFDEISERIPIRRIMESYGVTVREVDTYQQAKLTAAVSESLAEPRFNVVIAKHPCMLKFTREQKKKGVFRPSQVTVTEKCDQQHVCIAQFGCPSFSAGADGSVSVNEDLCIGDGSCLQTCPTKALDITRKGEQ